MLDSTNNKGEKITFEMISLYYFSNILVQITENNRKQMDIIKIYIKLGDGKCQR